MHQIHQVIENLVHKLDFQNNYLDKNDPWSGILEASTFPVQGTNHKMLQDAPVNLVFRCDMILNTVFVDEQESFRRRKQQIIDKKLEKPQTT